MLHSDSCVACFSSSFKLSQFAINSGGEKLLMYVWWTSCYYYFILQPSQVSQHSFKDVFSRLTLTCRQDLSDRLRLVCTDEKTILSSASFIDQFRMHGFLVVNPPRGWPHLSKSDGGVAAQLVERSTEKPGAVLFVWQGIFHPESTFSANSLTVSIQPLCAIACINIHTHIKNHKRWQPYHCLDTQKHCTLIGMGNTALA